MKKSFVIFCFSINLIGCASVSYNYAPETKLQSIPAFEVASVAAVGEPLLTQGLASTFETIIVPKQTAVSIINVEQGSYKKVGENEDFEYYSTFKDKNSGSFSGNSKMYTTITVRIKRGSGDTCFIGDAFQMCPNPSVKLEYTKAQATVLSVSDFQQTLYYNGKVGNKIKIGYREFSGDIARPAFSNEAEYDLSESDVIGYKGATLKIIEADNIQIKYKVLSNFK